MISKVYNLDDETFQKLILNSTSYSSICESVGLSINGSNGKYQIQKRCKELNIPFNHLTGKSKEKRPSSFYSHPKYSLEEILVENSTYTNRTQLKKRLIQEKYLNYKCAICGNQGEWNGKPLSLQLDHINGINNDNRIENLRLLCPNCHSQTETFSGHNKKTTSY